MPDILSITSQWKGFFNRAETVATVLEYAGRILLKDLLVEGALITAADDLGNFSHRFSVGAIPLQFDKLSQNSIQFQRFIKRAQRVGEHYRFPLDRTRSALVVPLIAQESQILGFIALVAKLNSQSLFYLNLLRDTITHSLYHLKSGEYFTKQLDQLSALLAINNELATTFDLHTILALINRKVRELGLGNFVDIGIIDTKTRTINPVLDVAGGVVELSKVYSQLSVKVGNGITGQATLQGRSVVINDVSKNKSYMTGPGRESVKSEVAIPLRDKNRVMGVINFESNRLAAYAEDDVRFLESLANQAAIAIRNAQLFNTVVSEQNKLASILAAIPDPVVVLGPDRTLLTLNVAAEKELGLELSNVIGKRLESLFPKENLGQLVKAATTRQDKTLRTEISKAGRTFDLHFSALSDDKGVVVLFVDITKRKELDQARADFTAMLIHDLRAPLSTIIGSLDFTIDAEDNSLSETSAKLLTNAREDSYRILGMINELLEASRLEAGRFDLRFEPTALADLIEASLHSLHSYAREKKITVQFVRPAEPIIALVDRNRIIRVMINLIENAIKYTASGGKVRVAVSAEILENTKFARVKVVDTGCGIPHTELPFVFDRYRKLKGQGSGFGLGLSISKLIVEAHGGRIWAESKPGTGSIFNFTLPLS